MTDFSAIATVLRRELLSGLRTTSSFMLLLGAVSIMMLAALMAIAGTGANSAFAGSRLQMLYAVQMGLYNLMVYLMTPTLAAVCVNSERREENHELLATSLLPPRSVLLGKYLAVLARTLLMASALLPFTGLLYFYAGLDPATLYEDGLKLTFSACAGAAIGLWSSSRYGSPAAALFATLGVQFILFSLPGLVMLSSAFGYSDIMALADLVRDFAMRHPLLAHGLHMGSITLLFLALGLWRAEGIFRDAAESATLPARLNRWYRFRPIPEGANPFRYRDGLGSALNIPSVRWAAFAVTLTGYSLLVYASSDLDADALRETYALERLAMVALLPPLIAVLLVRERDPATLEAYRMTLLGGSDALSGKLLGLARLALPFWGAMLLVKLAPPCLAVLSSYLHPYDWKNPDPFVIFEPVHFPLHLMLVALAASFGAAGPRRLIPAVLAGFATVALAGFFWMILTGMLLSAAMIGSDTSSLGYFLLNWIVSLFYALLLWGCAASVLSTHWADNYVDRVPDYYQKQQQRVDESAEAAR